MAEEDLRTARSLRARIAQFGRWFVSPSWATLAAAAVVLAGLAVVALGPDDLSYRLQRAVTGGDVYASRSLHLYNQLIRLRADSAAETRPIIAYVGGSTTRESIISEQALAERIRANGGPDVRVQDMTSAGQDMMLTWAVAELAACSGADVVLVGVNPVRLSKPGINHPIDKIGFLGPDAQAYVESGAVQARLEALNSRLVSVPRARLGNFLTVTKATLEGAVTASEANINQVGLHRFVDRPPDPVAVEASLAKIEAILAVNAGTTDDLLTGMVRSVQRCGARLVVMTSVLNPLALVPGRYPHLQQVRAVQLAELEAAGVAPTSIIELERVGVFTPADFHDWGHFRSMDAIGRTSEYVAQALARMIPEGSP